VLLRFEGGQAFRGGGAAHIPMKDQGHQAKAAVHIWRPPLFLLHMYVSSTILFESGRHKVLLTAIARWSYCIIINFFPGGRRRRLSS
jgi:hypothetical protein